MFWTTITTITKYYLPFTHSTIRVKILRCLIHLCVHKRSQFNRRVKSFCTLFTPPKSGKLSKQ